MKNYKFTRFLNDYGTQFTPHYEFIPTSEFLLYLVESGMIIKKRSLNTLMKNRGWERAKMKINNKLIDVFRRENHAKIRKTTRPDESDELDKIVKLIFKEEKDKYILIENIRLSLKYFGYENDAINNVLNYMSKTYRNVIIHNFKYFTNSKK